MLKSRLCKHNNIFLKGRVTFFFMILFFLILLTFEGTLFFGNAVIFWTYAIIFRNAFFGEKSWTHGPTGPFWEGRGLQSTSPVSKNNDFGILAADLADPAHPTETVAAATARTPLHMRRGQG